MHCSWPDLCPSLPKYSRDTTHQTYYHLEYVHTNVHVALNVYGAISAVSRQLQQEVKAREGSLEDVRAEMEVAQREKHDKVRGKMEGGRVQ